MARHGENIRKRKDGRWEARYIQGYRTNGKAMYRSVYGRTYQEVKRKRQICMTQRGQQTAATKNCTFGEAAQMWLPERRTTPARVLSRAEQFALEHVLFAQQTPLNLGGADVAVCRAAHWRGLCAAVGGHLSGRGNGLCPQNGPPHSGALSGRGSPHPADGHGAKNALLPPRHPSAGFSPALSGRGKAKREGLSGKRKVCAAGTPHMPVAIQAAAQKSGRGRYHLPYPETHLCHTLH